MNDSNGGEPRSSRAASAHEAAQRTRILNILDAYLEELDGGLATDPSDLLARHPDLEEELRPYLASLELIRGTAGSLRAHPEFPGAAAESTDTGVERILGDYRILREVGRGGMGVVYEAEQISLGRRVALKVLPFAAVLDARQLQRFQNEARAAAQLHHTNIVPVYSVGCERGVHYYAMQHIDGRDLERVIDEAAAASGVVWGSGERSSTCDPEYYRTVALLGAQAAEALAHAHAHGVVHRDVKPSNLLLDGAGVLWITDFGLAKLDAARSCTGTGDLVGTARYMSPEQARGGYVDERTDVYSLGITLYELATLRRAFEGTERARILTQIETEDPAAPRRLNPRVPRDLEVIIQKAIAKEPADRYATAADLAADLRAFAAGCAIAACRPGIALRARRWASRHRRLVAASAAILILAIAGLVTANLLLLEEEKRTRAALEAAERERAAAETNLSLAQEAVDKLLRRVGGEKLANVPGFETVRRELLEEALGFYERFLERAPQSPRLRREVVRALGQVGAIRRKLGKVDEAEKAYRGAAEAAEEVVAESPEDRNARSLLASQLNNLGIALRELGKPKEAEAVLRRAVELREQLAIEAGDSSEALAELAVALGNLGSTLALLGRLPESRDCLEKAIRRFETAARADPPPRTAREGLSYNWKSLGLVLARLGERVKAEEAYQSCLEVRQKLAADFSAEAEPLDRLADIRYTRGIYFQHTGRPVEAEREYREGLTARERLAREYPAVPAYHRDLGALLNNLAMMVLERGELREARQLIERALVSQREALRLGPQIEAAGTFLLNHLGALTDIARDLGDLPAAEKACRELIAERSKLVESSPERKAGLVRQSISSWILGKNISRHSLKYPRRMPFQALSVS